MANSGWIDVRERMPSREDADATNRVLVWHVLNGCMMLGWHKVCENRFVTHWQPSPEGPEGAKQMSKDALFGTDARFR